MDLTETQIIERDQPNLIFSPHPILMAKDRQVIHAEFLPDETIEAYLERTGIRKYLRNQPYVLTINGRRMPRRLWKGCRPKPGTLINLYAISRGGGGGGGGGKNPIATVGMIALMVMAPGIGAGIAEMAGIEGGIEMFGATIKYSSIIGTAVSVVGGLVLNSIFPPPKPTLAEAQQTNAGGDETLSPTYAIGGGANQFRRYSPFPLMIGTHRIVPDYGSQAYTEFDGDDQFAYYIFDYGYNDIVLSEHKIGASLLTTFSDYTIQESDTTGVLTLFPGNVDSQPGVNLAVGNPAVIRTSSITTTQIAIDIVGSLYAVTGTGALTAHTANVELLYRAVGAVGWSNFIDSTSELVISSASRKPIRQTYRRTVPSGQYEVSVRLASAYTDSLHIAEFSWSQMRSYQPDTADYTGRKRVALRVRASGQLSGNLDQFSSQVQARCLTWNGTDWVTAITSNPAWWFLAIARGKTVGTRRVWGGGLADSRIDIENLKLFGAWCDAQTPPLTFNGIFDQPTSVYDMLAAVALMGRATVSWGTGKLGVIWDEPDLPVTAVFGMHNIIPGTFEISYGTDDLADVIVGEYINPDMDWQKDFVRVQVPGQTTTVNERKLQLFGRTSRALAAQDTNLYAAQNAYRNRKYTWQTDWEGMPCSRGDVVELTHDMASLDYSGRFFDGGNTTNIKLSREVPKEAGGSFIVIIRPNGEISTHTVAGGAGDSDVLTLNTPLDFDPWNDADHPPYDYKWAYGPTETPGKLVKIESFKPVSERLVEIRAVDELSIFYTAKDNPYSYTPTRTIFGGAPTISNLSLTEDGIRVGTGYMVKIYLVWNITGDYGFSDIRVGTNGGPMLMAATNVRGTSAELLVQDLSDLVIEVRAFSSLGRMGKSSTASLTQTVDFASQSPPAQVSTFTINGDIFTWTGNTEVDVIGYRIKFNYGVNLSWGTATLLYDGLVTETTYQPPSMPSGSVTFMIVAVDAAGLESEETAVIITDLGDPDVANILETVDYEALGWPGTITNGVISGSNVVASSSTSFYAEDDSSPMYTSSDTDPFYKLDTYETVVYETTGFTPALVLVGSQMTLAHTITGSPVTIEYRTAGDTPMYGIDSDPFYGADADPFYDAPGEWMTWPGSVEAAYVEYQFRITIGGGAVQGVIDHLVLTIDAPDLEEDFDDIVIAAGGTRLTLTKDFTVIKNIKLTLQFNGGTALKAETQDKDATSGPLIKCFNASNVATSGLIDATVKGY